MTGKHMDIHMNTAGIQLASQNEIALSILKETSHRIHEATS